MRSYVNCYKKSLERPGIHWSYIYQYHGWDDYRNIDEIFSSMQNFMDNGKVIYPATLNFSA